MQHCDRQQLSGEDAAHPFPGAELEAVIEAYECARADDPDLDFRGFLPAADDSEYAEIAVELARVDLELSFRAGTPRPLRFYCQLLPDVLADPEYLSRVAFEDYRLSFQAGSRRGAEDYKWAFGVDTSEWPAWSSQDAIDIPECRLSSNGDDPFSRLGSAFSGFELVGELGRGSAGRVYLARQGDLADRYMALKITVDSSDEPQRLAELQHTNIVPIYSVHQHDGFQAVCMPMLGAATLSDVLAGLGGLNSWPAAGSKFVEIVSEVSRATVAKALWHRGNAPNEQDLSFCAGVTRSLDFLMRESHADAVAWLAARIVDGLAHAHEQHLIHGDLKPANILISGNGQPLILDFHLSVRSCSGNAAGGTLAYMAPEHICAYQAGSTVDVRCDIYSVGLILYELLTGSTPFPVRTGPEEEVYRLMLEDRRHSPPSVRQRNPQVSPDLAAIVAHCIQPDPADRYATARQLQTDLELHRKDLPLCFAPGGSLVERARKFSRRHPRVTSGSTIGAISTVVLLCLFAGLLVRGHQVKRAAAVDTARSFETQALERIAPLAVTAGDLGSTLDSIEEAKDLLREHHAFESNRWQSESPFTMLDTETGGRFARKVAELQFLVASASIRVVAMDDDPERSRAMLVDAERLNELASAAYIEEPRAFLVKKSHIARLRGETKRAETLRKRAAKTPAPSYLEKHLMLLALVTDDVDDETLRELEDNPPRDPLVWFVLGNIYRDRDRTVEAESCFTSSIMLAPRSYAALLGRGTVRFQNGKYEGAMRDFQRCLELRPNWPAALFHRALALVALKREDEALSDLNAALENRVTITRAYLVRSKLLGRRREHERARYDLQQFLKLTPTDVTSWISRGVARSPDEPHEALKDFQRAVDINPRCRLAWINMASVLSQRLENIDEAVAAMDRVVALGPDNPKQIATRGVLLSRLGRRQEAHEDARAALLIDRSADTLIRVSGIFAQTSLNQPADSRVAVRLLQQAAWKDPLLVTEYLKVDQDLAPLKARPSFREFTERLAEYRAGLSTLRRN